MWGLCPLPEEDPSLPYMFSSNISAVSGPVIKKQVSSSSCPARKISALSLVWGTRSCPSGLWGPYYQGARPEWNLEQASQGSAGGAEGAALSVPRGARCRSPASGLSRAREASSFSRMLEPRGTRRSSLTLLGTVPLGLKHGNQGSFKLCINLSFTSNPFSNEIGSKSKKLKENIQLIFIDSY